MCNQPNVLTGATEVQMKLVEGLDDYSKALYIRTGGHQAFEITYNPGLVQLTPLSNELQERSDLLSSTLRQIVKDMTILDIGGGYGYFSALSVAHGAKAATIVDMDKAYSTRANEIYNFLGPPFSDRIHIQNKTLQEMDEESADIVIALDLIHWSFNCFESAGSLVRAVGRLARRAKKLLIIEWVEPADLDIKRKNHRSQPLPAVNGGDESADVSVRSTLYSFENFNLTMRRIFQCSECFQELAPITPTTTPSRRIFVGVHRKPSLLTDADVDIRPLNSNYEHVDDLFDVL